MRIFFLILMCAGWPFCFRAADAGGPSLPAEITLSPEAGHGGHIMVTVRLGSGDEVPFVVDTGASITILDVSLVSKLGGRVDTATIARPGDRRSSSVYRAPRFYLGGTQLVTGSNVFTYDFKRPMGILGMDCLKHYCIQLDFQAGKMRFLDPARVTRATPRLGWSFPMRFSPGGPGGDVVLPVIEHSGLIGEDTDLVIDTGCNIDGLADETVTKGRMVYLPECYWAGGTYSNLILASPGRVNVLGLGFLARHLVTFNFPQQTMYLKQTSAGSLAEDALMEVASREIRPAMEVFENLRKSNRLPGWSKEDKRAVFFEVHSAFVPQITGVKGAAYLMMHSRPVHNAVTFDFQREGESSMEHYTIWRPERTGPWKLRRAWRTDRGRHVIERFSIQ